MAETTIEWTVKDACNNTSICSTTVNVVLQPASGTLTKTPDTDWNEVIPSLREFLKEYLEEGKVVINEDEIVKPAESNTASGDDSEIVVRIKELLENYVKPAVEMDGGAISFKSYHNGSVTLSLQGSCSGCPSSMITLKSGIEGMMKRMIPEVKEVLAEAV